MAIKETENPVNTAISVRVITRTGSPSLKQLTFNWEATDKNQEL